MNCIRASGSSATSRTGRTFSRSPRRTSVAATAAGPPLAVRDTLRRSQIRWWRSGGDLAELVDHGGRAARRDDRIEDRELLRRGDLEQAGQAGDVFSA